MAVFKCKMCGGDLEIHEHESVAVCEYCGTKQTLPKLDDEKRMQLYDRANHFRRNNDFDKAMGIYENILNEDNTDAEAYWSLVLCRYGVEYVEDPSTHKRVPTVNRTQYTSIFDDEDYKSAIEYADAAQKAVYEAEANAINEIQKGILEISQKEEPFDVFICYKETDTQGRRTRDSVIATELYYELQKAGFKVFFSRISLEDKLGTAYEPYIFAALHSSKVMVVLGTKAEYFNAVWVKNEWSRYLSLIKNGDKKILIPAYRDMDPYDLPEEFSHLQAQDMSKLGFMQDLIYGIKKIVTTDAPKTAVKETVIINQNSGEVEPLLKRVSMFLEDGDFASADEYCEKVLDLDPENANAYLGKLMAELKIRNFQSLSKLEKRFDCNSNYKKIMRFGNDEIKKKMTTCLDKIDQNILAVTYQQADKLMQEASSLNDWSFAADAFHKIITYKDAKDKEIICRTKIVELRKESIYIKAIEYQNKNTIDDLHRAINGFSKILDWKDSQIRVEECHRSIHNIKNKIQRANVEQLLEKNKKEEIRQKKNYRKQVIKKLLLSIIPISLALFWLMGFILSCFVDKRWNEAIPLALLFVITICSLVDFWKTPKDKKTRRRKNIIYVAVSFILIIAFGLSLGLNESEKQLIQAYYGKENYQILEDVNLIQYASPSNIDTKTGEFKTDRDGNPLEIEMENGIIISIFVPEKKAFIYNLKDAPNVCKYPFTENQKEEKTSTKPTETHTEAAKKIYTLSTQEYYDKIEQICITNSQNTAFTIYRRDTSRYPYYWFYFQLNKELSEEEYSQAVDKISRDIYNDILKNEYKKKGLMDDTGGIISLQFITSQGSNEKHKIVIQMRVLNMEENKPYEENVQIFD